MGLASVVNSAGAPAGSLDPTFAKGGKVTTNFRTTGTSGIVTTNFADRHRRSERTRYSVRQQDCHYRKGV